MGALQQVVRPFFISSPRRKNLSEHLEVCSSDFYLDVHALLDQGFYIY